MNNHSELVTAQMIPPCQKDCHLKRLFSTELDLRFFPMFPRWQRYHKVNRVPHVDHQETQAWKFGRYQIADHILGWQFILGGSSQLVSG